MTDAIQEEVAALRQIIEKLHEENRRLRGDRILDPVVTHLGISLYPGDFLLIGDPAVSVEFKEIRSCKGIRAVVHAPKHILVRRLGRPLD